MRREEGMHGNGGAPAMLDGGRGMDVLSDARLEARFSGLRDP